MMTKRLYFTTCLFFTFLTFLLLLYSLAGCCIPGDTSAACLQEHYNQQQTLTAQANYSIGATALAEQLHLLGIATPEP